MKIVNEYPPVYERICEVIGKPPENALYAYGDTIYNPSGLTIPEDVIAHEEIHELQQGGDPVDWWNKYLADPEFRLDQELEAYRHQYKFIQNKTKDRELLNFYLRHFAKALSGPMYGNLMGFEEAITKIKQ